MSSILIDPRVEPERAGPIIPGAYERNTLTYRQPGSVGGSAFGSTIEPIGPSSMGAATIADREREGGGAPNQRRPPVTPKARTGAAIADGAHRQSRLTGGYLWSQILRLARR